MLTGRGPDGTTFDTVDVSDANFGADIDFEALSAVHDAPALLTSAERLLLYTLIFCLRPKRYLEVGIYEGGASLIAAKAMDAAKNDGRLVLVDSEPRLDDSLWRTIEHRSTLVKGWSPGALKQAAEASGEPFDFVFVDAGHQTNAVMRDANGVFRYLADGAYILFHDSFRRDVGKAIDMFVRMHFGSIIDFGFLTREFTRNSGSDGDPGKSVSCGFRLIQYRRSHGVRRPAHVLQGVFFRFQFIFRQLVRACERQTRRALRFLKR